MNRSILLLFFGFSLLCSITQAQSFEKIWEKSYAQFDGAVFCDAVTEEHGNAYVTGSARLQNKEQGLFAILLPDGTISASHLLGDSIEGKFEAMAITSDRHFVLAGQARSERKNSWKGWIVKINSKGEIVWQFMNNSEGHSSYRDIIQSETGDIIAVGEKGQNLCLTFLTEKGKWQENKYLPNQYKGYAGQALLESPNDDLLIIGNSKKEKCFYLWKYELLPDWKLKSEKLFPGLVASNIVADLLGGYLIAANTAIGRINGVSIHLDAISDDKIEKLVVAEHYRHRIKKVLRAPNDHLYFIGYSFAPGAQRSQVWLTEYNEMGDRDSRFSPKTFGNPNRFSEGWNLIPWGFKRFLALGFNETSKDQNAWAMRVELPQLLRPASIVIDSISLISSDTLDSPNDISSFRVHLKNLGETDSEILIPEIVTNPVFAKDLYFQSPTIPPINAMDSSQFTFSIKNSSESLKRDWQVHFCLKNLAGNEITCLSFNTRRYYVPKLAAWVSPTPSLSQKDNVITLYFQLINFGVDTLNNPSLNIWTPAGVLPEDSLKTLLPLAPKDQIEVQLKLTISEEYQIMNIPLNLRLFDPSVPSYMDISWNIERQETLLNFDWIEPENRGDTILSQVITVQVQVSSNTLLQKEMFTFLNNEAVIENNLKSDIVALDTSRSKVLSYRVLLEMEIPLVPGENNIVVQFQNKALTKRQGISVFYEPKPNLYLFAFGIPSKDLLYTENDAIDFAKIFGAQEDKLFGAININVFTSKSSTRGKSIIDTISNFVESYNHVIRERDIMILFFSSHGYTKNNKFFLQDSDFRTNPNNPNNNIDFETEVIDILANVSCNRIVFVDACRIDKGGKEEKYAGLNETIFNIIKQKPDLSFILSCKQGEFSFESRISKHGIFTQAILDGLSGKVNENSNGNKIADANGDKYITLSELFHYIEKRVPNLIPLEYKGLPQTPTPSISQKNTDLPLFYTNY